MEGTQRQRGRRRHTAANQVQKKQTPPGWSPTQWVVSRQIDGPRMILGHIEQSPTMWLIQPALLQGQGHHQRPDKQPVKRYEGD
jgi:hypothetical protein